MASHAGDSDHSIARLAGGDGQLHAVLVEVSAIVKPTPELVATVKAQLEARRAAEAAAEQRQVRDLMKRHSGRANHHHRGGGGSPEAQLIESAEVLRLVDSKRGTAPRSPVPSGPRGANDGTSSEMMLSTPQRGQRHNYIGGYEDASPGGGGGSSRRQRPSPLPESPARAVPMRPYSRHLVVPMEAAQLEAAQQLSEDAVRMAFGCSGVKDADRTALGRGIARDPAWGPESGNGRPTAQVLASTAQRLGPHGVDRGGKPQPLSSERGAASARSALMTSMGEHTHLADAVDGALASVPEMLQRQHGSVAAQRERLRISRQLHRARQRVATAQQLQQPPLVASSGDGEQLAAIEDREHPQLRPPPAPPARPKPAGFFDGVKQQLTQVALRGTVPGQPSRPCGDDAPLSIEGTRAAHSGAAPAADDRGQGVDWGLGEAHQGAGSHVSLPPVAGTGAGRGGDVAEAAKQRLNQMLERRELAPAAAASPASSSRRRRRDDVSPRELTGRMAAIQKERQRRAMSQSRGGASLSYLRPERIPGNRVAAEQERLVVRCGNDAASEPVLAAIETAKQVRAGTAQAGATR